MRVTLVKNENGYVFLRSAILFGDTAMRVTLVKAENGYVVLIGALNEMPKIYIHESLEEAKNRIDFLFR